MTSCLQRKRHFFQKNFLFLSFFQNGGKLFLNYNLGSKDITIGDITTKVNDGRYHVVRFTRSDTNSSMQVDDNPIHTKFPQGKSTKPLKSSEQGAIVSGHVLISKKHTSFSTCYFVDALELKQYKNDYIQSKNSNFEIAAFFIT